MTYNKSFANQILNDFQMYLYEKCNLINYYNYNSFENKTI